MAPQQVERFDPRVFNQFAVIQKGYAPQLSPWLSPVVNMGKSTPYERDVEDGLAFCCGTEQPATPALFAAVELVCENTPPAGVTGRVSKRIIVDRCVAFQTVPATGVIRMGSIAASQFGAAVVDCGKILLPGQIQRPQSTAQIGQGTLGGLLASRYISKLGTAQTPVVELIEPGKPFVFGPGRGLIVHTEVVNVALQVYFEWREVPLVEARI